MEEDAAHFVGVLRSFDEYWRWMVPEVHRRERHAALLSEKFASLLPEGWMRQKHGALRKAVVLNQDFLSVVVQSHAALDDSIHIQHAFHLVDALKEADGAHGTDAWGTGSFRAREVLRPHAEKAELSAMAPIPASLPVRSFHRDVSKTKATLRQCVRDWSDEGRKERDANYGPLLEELCRLVPIYPSSLDRPRVSVPGAGLGRLLVEVVARGYHGEGNEFSFHMLTTAHVILNEIEEANSVRLCPWIHSDCNQLHPKDGLRIVSIPDQTAAEILERGQREEDPRRRASLPSPQLSMAAGDFVRVYSDESHRGRWDAVVTCFFVDTAPVAMQYIECIYDMLREGGVWVNLGPLMYHWEDAPPPGSPSYDSRYEESVGLSYEELRHAIQAHGFTILKESVHFTPYAENPRSLSRAVYRSVLFSARKTDPPLSAEAIERAKSNLAADPCDMYVTGGRRRDDEDG